jgi:hypothetical protein
VWIEASLLLASLRQNGETLETASQEEEENKLVWREEFSCGTSARMKG